MPDSLTNLIDDYLDGNLDETRLVELEELLRADPEARRHFVAYARLHTDLQLEARAVLVGQRALGRIEQLDSALVDSSLAANTPGAASPKRFSWRGLGIAACLLLALGSGWWLAVSAARGATIAWLVNAQNCEWGDNVDPAKNMQAGTILHVERGLAEIRFRCGARVVLEGPARLELVSEKGARLLHGKLTARVPDRASGFEILSPQGKIIDLGTEFGMAVGENGTTDVYVFEGKVEALPSNTGTAARGHLSLTRNQAARIAEGNVVRRKDKHASEASQFVRAIVPPPAIVPRILNLAFDRHVENSIPDANGLGTGLTRRMPGTGRTLPKQDANLRLDPARGRLELITTDSDLNGQYKLYQGEYLGVRLSDLGFTGPENFAVTATILDIPALEVVGQFGLYAGPRSDHAIRGGLLSAKRGEPGQYKQFLVNNHEGRDHDLYRVGLLSTGTDLRLTLKRIDGKFSLTVDNLTDGSSSTLTIRHPDFLDNEREMFVGLFGANTRSNVRKSLFFKEFQATVWTVAAPVFDKR